MSLTQTAGLLLVLFGGLLTVLVGVLGLPAEIGVVVAGATTLGVGLATS